MNSISPKNLYQRQTTLREFGKRGQEKLSKARVVIIGCGGLGSVAAVYLASSGIGHIHLVDFDTVDVSNLHRQVFFSPADVGKPKVEVLSRYIQANSPLVKVVISQLMLQKSNVNELISTADVVLDCTDDLATKYLLNDACVLEDKVLVYGSLYKFDGYVATFNFTDENGHKTANLRDAFPEIPKEHIPNCSELGTLNSIVGIIGLMQANEVLKIVANIGKPIVNELLIYNSLDNSQFRMKIKPKTSSFEQKKQISEAFQQEKIANKSKESVEELTISQSEFKELLAQKDTTIKIISVLEELPETSFKIDENVPFYDIDIWLEELEETDTTFVMVCNRGNTSMMATRLFKEQFPEVKVLSLEGGILGFN